MNGNVGIGTWVPSSLLNVGGTINIGNNYGSGYNGIWLNGSTASGNYNLLSSTSDANLYINRPTGKSIYFNEGDTATHEMIITNGGNVGIGTTTPAGGLAVMNGNVGIGTWVPSALLHLGVDNGASPDLLIGTGGNSTNNYISFNAGRAMFGYDYSTNSDNGVNSGMAAITGGGSKGIEFLVNGTSGTLVSGTKALTIQLTGNVGIGTWSSLNGRLLISGNVGIGSNAPGQALDVQGTVRTTNFTMTGQTPVSGYVLTASDSAGDATWSTAGGVSGWTITNTNDVYETNGGNVGIGTNLTSKAALTVMNGNVGIGTWVPSNSLDIEGGALQLGPLTGSDLGSGGMLLNNHIVFRGSGSSRTQRAIIFDSSTGTRTGAVSSEWLTTNFPVELSDGTNVRLGFDTNGNVGIGTTTPVGGLAVMNGNVGIGTWVPAQALYVMGNITASGAINIASGAMQLSSNGSANIYDASGVTLQYYNGSSVTTGFILNSSGNVGIGTTTPQGGLVVTNGNVGIGTWVPSALLHLGVDNGASPDLLIGTGGNSTNNYISFNAGRAMFGYDYSTNSDNGVNSGMAAITGGGSKGIEFLVNGTSGTLVSGTKALTIQLTGNVGIGTWSSLNGRLLISGNVGIGSNAPGQALDVQGTVRTTNFTMTGQTPVSGYVLTASDSAGDTTWSAASSVGTNYWLNTAAAGNVGISTTNTVGIGTTSAGVGTGLVVMNGNVGIGTWVPAANVDIRGNTSGNPDITVGDLAVGPNNHAIQFVNTNNRSSEFGLSNNRTLVQSDNYGINLNIGSTTVMYVNGDILGNTYSVGIGTTVPGYKFDVEGGAINTSGGLYSQGNVGIGTTTPVGGLVVMNGNVGIGTWVPGGALSVMNGNVGIGTWLARSLLDVSGLAIARTSGPQTGGLQIINQNGTEVVDLTQRDTASGEIDVFNSGATETVRIQGGGNTYLNGGTFTVGTSSNPSSSVGISGNAAIGSAYATLSAPTNGLIVQGNVGIGTSLSANLFDVAGGISIGATYAGYQTAPSNGLAVQGNVGIGTWVPGQLLDVKGTVRTTNFTMTGQTPVSGYVLTASDSAGDATWSTASSVGSNYWLNTAAAGNVGISTTNTVGIGTTSAGVGTGLTVMNGNVGIGTWVPNGALGLTQGEAVALDSSGSRTIYSDGSNIVLNGQIKPTGTLTMVGNSITTVGNITGNAGMTVYGSATSSQNLTLDSTSNATKGNIIIAPSSGNVGIGTTTPVGALTVMNGNVGIGTWVPSYQLAINGNVGITSGELSVSGNSSYINFSGANYFGGTTIFRNGSGTFQNAQINGDGTSTTNTFFAALSGNVGIGTTTPAGGLAVMNGNVGVGTWVPGQKLDVIGTIRTTNFTMTGQTPVSGYVLTASDSAGDATWSTAGGVSGWTITNTNDVYETNGGNVGIGTNLTSTSALTVMNGNVGIGTWVPANLLDVGGKFNVDGSGNITLGAGTKSFTSSSGSLQMELPTGNLQIDSNFTTIFNNVNKAITTTGNVGIGTTLATTAALSVMNGNVGIGTWVPGGALVVMNGNVGIGTNSPTTLLSLNGSGATNGITFGGNATTNLYWNGTVGSNGTLVTDGLFKAAGNIYGGALYSNDIYNYTGSTLTLHATTTYIQNNLGIGTTTPIAGLAVMNGNVGIGTWAPGGALTVMNGNVGIGVANPDQALVLSGNSGTSLEFGVGTGNSIAAQSNEIRISQASSSGKITFYNNGGGTLLGQFGPTNVLLAPTTGNIGISSSNPGQALDVQGTVRTTNFTMTGQTPVSGYVLTASDSAGDATWSMASGISGWTITNTNDVYETNGGNVGIGTNLTSRSALTVMNGNVGIGTWIPVAPLDISNGVLAISLSDNAAIDWKNPTVPSRFLADSSGATAFMVGDMDNAGGRSLRLIASVGRSIGFWQGSTSQLGILDANGNLGIGTITPIGGLTIITGNVGVGTWKPVGALDIKTGNNVLVETGNVGIGSLNPSQALDVIGTVRTTNFTMTGQTPVSGYVLTASDSAGDTTWTAAGAVGGWSTGSGTVYTTTGSNNVGIGTSTPQGGLVVTNGNVGIGTWVPGQALDVKGTVRTTNFTMTGQTPVSGYVLTASDSSGDATWSTSSSVGTNYWLNTAASGNVGISTTNTVGIGTTSGGAGTGLTIMNGNLGIGTWAPNAMLESDGPMIVDSPSNGAALVRQATDGLWLFNSASSSGGRGAAFEVDYSGNTSTGNNFQGLNAAAGMQPGTANLTATTFGGGLRNRYIIEHNGTGTIAQASAVTGALETGGSSNSPITDSAVFHAEAPSINASSTWGTYSGLWVRGGSISGTLTTQYGVRIDSLLAGAKTYGIYQAGSPDTNYFAGNVGIGSTAPGQKLDVQGTVRTTNFTMTGQTPVSGYVLTASDSNGDATWSTAGGVSGWTVYGNNVYETNNGNVGIGTNLTSTSALTVMNGNVGIGTWIPSRALEVEASNSGTTLTSASAAAIGIHNLNTTANDFADLAFSTLDSNGASKLGSKISGVFTNHTAGAVSGDMAFVTMNAGSAAEKMRLTAGGNLGIGSITPGQALDVQGTVRTTNFTMTGQTPVSGYVLTASDSAGDATWSTAGGVSGWTTSGNNVYETNGGNVGIGTSSTTQAALVVTNGNVGIGTWTPNSTFNLIGSQAGAYANVSSNTTLDASYYIVNVDSTAGPVTITLPTAVGIGGRCYRIKDAGGQAGVNNITINTNGGNIDGNATKTMIIGYQGYDVCSNNSNWFVY
jgi:hypothetical protein